MSRAFLSMLVTALIGLLADRAESRSIAAGVQILWTQYGLERDVLKLAVHTDADPLAPQPAAVRLLVEDGSSWKQIGESPVDSLTAMAEFRLDDWDASRDRKYRVVCGSSEWSGTFRREPLDQPTLRLGGVACINDRWFPYTDAVADLIAQNPDIVFFAGDQIYESNSGGEIVVAETEADVPAAMANYLAKWRKFGVTFRELLRDRPSIIITDDHDVYANDLWGDGGRRMTGDRTTGGYRMHPAWVNAAERTQTFHLPDAASPGPWGDGIRAYFTSLDYGGVSFAIIEDRKFKSPPSDVLAKSVDDPAARKPNQTLEVIKDPSFDVSALDRADLELLGKAQEAFLGSWSARVASEGRLAAVLSQSPLVNIGNYEADYGDMDANGWPQTARNRALRAIAPSRAVMICGDIHLGTLLRHGIDAYGDGPYSYSLPAFSSTPNRVWKPKTTHDGGAIAGVEGSGNHRDRFGNRMTVLGAAHGENGYGIIVFDKKNRRITFELHPFDADKKPSPHAVPGWPLTIEPDAAAG